MAQSGPYHFRGLHQDWLMRRNPLDFEMRKAMLQVAFLDSLDKLTILPLQDKETDEQWSQKLTNVSATS